MQGMRRIFPWKPIFLKFFRTCSSDSLLDDIFSELSACDITQKQNQSKIQNKSPSKGVSSGNLETTTTNTKNTNTNIKNDVVDDAEIQAELSKRDHLQKLLQEAMDQADLTKKEELKAEEVNRHSRYVVSPPASLRLSTAELIQDKSPQHFTSDKDLSSKLSALPHLNSPGSVAVVTLVGKVLSEAIMHGEEVSSDDNNKKDSISENAPHARFLVQYSVPFMPSSISVTVQVRCYGATLSSFAKRHVKIGDLVHILGHLLPLDLNTMDDPRFCVCALPVGGNISVVLSAEHDSVS